MPLATIQAHLATLQVHLATLHVHLHFLHHLRGATIDYVGLAVAACVSWIIGIGPGEPLVVAAGVFAARHKLDISPVVFWAWIGATVGGVIGWLVGLKAGRTVLTGPGPLRQVRENSVHKGDALFKRREAVAIVLTPPWVAGIFRARPALYLPITAITALVLWAAPLAIGAYYIGPAVIELFDDLGLVLTIVLGAIVVALVAGEVLRRRRRRTTRTSVTE